MNNKMKGNNYDSNLLYRYKDKDTKDYQLTDEFINKVIIDEFAKEYPLGFTITKTTGYYRHDDGQVIEEKSYIVTVLGADVVNHTLVHELKGFLNQESIGIQVINDNVIFE